MKYIKQEIPDLNKKGTPQHYYKVELAGRISHQQLLSKMASHGSKFNAGEMESVFEEFTSTLVELLCDGYAVEVKGVGTFRPIIGLKDDKEKDSLEAGGSKRNAQSLEVKDINIKASKRLVEQLRSRAHLELSGTKRLHEKLYTREQRLQMFLDFLAENKFAHICDYANLTKISMTQATKELREFAADPASGITRQGKKASLIYLAK